MEEGGKQGIEECLVNTESGADDHVVPTVPANKVSESTCQLFDLGYTDGYPKLIDIIWSCLTTIFACTWLTLHPNIPPPVNDQGHTFLQKRIFAVKKFIRHQLPPFLVALIAPEWILARAMQQWIIAKQISKEGGSSWTTAHGFFVSMGGFHAFVREQADGAPLTHESDEPCYPLHRDEVMQMYRDLQLDLPLESEIQDRGKTDWLAKTIVMLQSGWFVIQCIARRAAHLPLSELEVITLAYTVMNVGIYAAWWDKPRNVDRPIRVYIPREDAEKSKSKGVQKREEKDILGDNIANFIFPGWKDDQDLAGYASVPTFYVGSPNDGDNMNRPILVSSVVGTMFGAIHCIAWWYPFPSHAEQVLWRLSSTAIIGVPAFAFIILVTGLIIFENGERFYRTRWLSLIVEVIEDVIFAGLGIILMFLGPLLYVVSRVVTFVLAFKTLGSLPADAFHTIPWTKWIPHI
ncbi:hypothetical protein CPB86DRAFT_824443 [Serendipita vermifera]|nr:hypothetical protein CPB86DRAFT_824443 [Serendipita vermifera]